MKEVRDLSSVEFGKMTYWRDNPAVVVSEW